MLSLPPEIIEAILLHLDRPALCSVGRTCLILKDMCRPKILESITVKLVVTADTLDFQTLALDLRWLGINREYVKILAVEFDIPDNTNSRAVHPVHSGLISGMTALLQISPNLQALRLLQLPGQDAPGPALGPSAEISAFQQSLVELESIRALHFQAQKDRDCSWWLEALLPALPSSLKDLHMTAEFLAESTLSQTLASIPSNYELSLTTLYFSSSQRGEASDSLFHLLVHSSSNLSRICLSWQFCSEANTRDLFGSDRTHRHLSMRTYGYALLPECQHSLQQQLHLQNVDIMCGTEFSYYLPYLPPSVLDLQMEVLLHGPGLPAPNTQSPLALWGTVFKQCCLNTSWCPKLAHLDFAFLLHGENATGLEQYAQQCKQQQKDLLDILPKRMVKPAIRPSFWTIVDLKDY